MNCSNTYLYLFEIYFEFRILIEISFCLAIIISLTCFLASYLVDEESAEKHKKVGIYSSIYSLIALVLIIILPSKAMIENALNCGCI